MLSSQKLGVKRVQGDVIVFLFQVDGAAGRPGSSPDQIRRGLEEEFNVQRAKMKELFLQKEGSLPHSRREQALGA